MKLKILFYPIIPMDNNTFISTPPQEKKTYFFIRDWKKGISFLMKYFSICVNPRTTQTDSSLNNIQLFRFSCYIHALDHVLMSSLRILCEENAG